MVEMLANACLFMMVVRRTERADERKALPPVASDVPSPLPGRSQLEWLMRERLSRMSAGAWWLPSRHPKSLPPTALRSLLRSLVQS